jgi:serine phosphatase RsbU (regulator of sigma subunit)/FixJ family two-component response regulator
MAKVESDRLKLMVVDDEADNIDLLYRTFRQEFEVFRADSGIEALQILAEQGEMAVIISDQRMPRMNGTEFLSRTVELFPDTIRILLTGYTDIDDLVGAINSGKVFKYITKPWNSKELKTVVMQAADTYRVVKQRTNELHRALRRQSIFNAVTTAVRESLDYKSILATVVRTIGQSFAVDACLLRPIEQFASRCDCQCCLTTETFIYKATEATSITEPEPDLLNSLLQINQSRLITLYQSQTVHQTVHPPDQASELSPTQLPYTQLILPLFYQQEPLAILMMQRQGEADSWAEEDVGLIEEVAEQVALAISQSKLYQQIQSQTEQMRAELAVARQIQMNLFRHSLPELETVKIQAYCFPAREVGGDFFEIYVHPQGDVWLSVGDVSGKGVPAALFMASAISLLRRELAQEVSPAPNAVMRNLNHSLFENLVSSNCFITMVLARYRPATKELTYANAGHIYPLVWSQQLLVNATAASAIAETVAVEPTYLKTRSVPLGILADWQGADGHLIMQSGDAFLLTSDGLTEAALVDPASQQSTMLQQAGLWQLIVQQQHGLNLNDLVATIQAQTQVQEDDQTILSLEVL